MQTTVAGAGSLILRGLGPSGLLISRGLGGTPVTIIVEIPTTRPDRRGGSGRRDDFQQQEQVKCFFVKAKLVIINSHEMLQPIEGEIKVCYGTDKFRVTSTLPTITKRFTNIKARFVKK